MKIMLELCKQLSVESASHLKEQTDNLVGKPSVPYTSDGTADRTSQPDNVPKQSEVVGKGLESDISSNPRDNTPEVPEAVISGKSTEQQLQGTEGCSYVVGGSPVNPGTGKKCPHPILLSSALRDGFAGLIYFMGKYLVQVRDGLAAPGKKNSNPFLTDHFNNYWQERQEWPRRCQLGQFVLQPLAWTFFKSHTQQFLIMADSIATTTSVLGHRVLHQTFLDRSGSYKQRPYLCQIFSNKLAGQRLLLRPSSGVAGGQLYPRYALKIVRALAAELTKEAYKPKENDRISRDWRYAVESEIHGKQLWAQDNKADDPSLHNPLLRHERLGCGWLGAIFEWEGVIVEDDSKLEKQAWMILSQEEVKSPIPAFILRRIEGMKNEQALSEVLCWSRDPSELRRLAMRKEEIHRSLHGGFYQLRTGSLEFINTLANLKIPIAVTSTRPRKVIEEAVKSVGGEGSFDVIVGAEDVYRGKPDPEMFMYAAQQLNMIPERCIIFGNSNSTVEAAHDARMKCVAVASKHPLYELSAADMVVRRLSELSVVDLKNLAAVESPEFRSEEPEVEMELEEDPSPSRSVVTDDYFW